MTNKDEPAPGLEDDDGSAHETKANSRESSPTSRGAPKTARFGNITPAAANAAAVAATTASTGSAGGNSPSSLTSPSTEQLREMDALRSEIAAVEQSIEEADAELRNVLWDYIPRFKCKNIYGCLLYTSPSPRDRG